MRAVLPPAPSPANKLPAQTGLNSFDESFSGTIVSREEIWFALFVRDIWPVKGEAALTQYTGAPERTARAYKRGDRMPAATILRDLIKGSEGFRVISWIMRESKEPWWLNLNRAIKRSEAIDFVDKTT